MASRSYCIVCEKEKSTFRCDGCLKSYCKIHLNEHENELELELDKIENDRNIFRQTLSEQIEQPNKQCLIQQINQWEQQSINKIKKIAEENRQMILEEMNKHFQEIEVNLKGLTNQMKEIRQENDFNELNLNDLRNKLDKLQYQLNNPANILLQEENSSSFINKIYVNIPTNLKWKPNAITVAGGNDQGQTFKQLNSPWSIYVDDDQTIYIADRENHRIVEWKKGATHGQIIAGGNGQGNRNHQLNCPTKVIIDKVNDSFIIADCGNRRIVRWSRRNGTSGQILIKDIVCADLILHKNEYLYVCDDEKHEVRRWQLNNNENIIVAGGNGCGNNLNQLNTPVFIFIDQVDTLYVSDYSNHRVMKWTKDAKQGIVVAGGQGQGKSLKELNFPQGIFVDRFSTVYVADEINNRIVRWLKDAKEGSVIAGGNNKGNQANQFNCPVGLSFDDENNLYVTDYGNHRVQKFVVNSENLITSID